MDEPIALSTEPMIRTRAEFSRLLRISTTRDKVRLGGIDDDRFVYYAYKSGFPSNPSRLERLCSVAGIDKKRLDLNELVGSRYRTKFGLPPTKQKSDKVNETRPEQYKLSTEIIGYVINNDGIIIGSSTQMHKVFGLLDRITRNPDQDTIILIQGETGTGKELIARAIHYNSPRKDNPFVPINITNVQETLLESELFGHKKGAFTGASNDKEGFFEEVKNGTLFLDEIGSLNLDLQAKLLRVLQEKQFYKVGGTELVNFEGRVVTATKEDLEELLKDGKFRDDLFYRLNVVQVNLPPLRERGEDSLLLFRYFVEQHNRKYGTGFKIEPTKEGEEFLRTYEFPGNVRELENIIKRIIFNSEEEYIKIEALNLGNKPKVVYSSKKERFIEKAHSANMLYDKLNLLKKGELDTALSIYFDNKTNVNECAKNIGIDRSHFRKILKRLGQNPVELREIYLNVK